MALKKSKNLNLESNSESNLSLKRGTVYSPEYGAHHNGHPKNAYRLNLSMILELDWPFNGAYEGPLGKALLFYLYSKILNIFNFRTSQ